MYAGKRFNDWAVLVRVGVWVCGCVCVCVCVCVWGCVWVCVCVCVSENQLWAFRIFMKNAR
jgi:hypothetical protein